MTAQLSLPVCALPGCPVPVSVWGAVCPDCQSAFGLLLQATGRTVTEDQARAELEARDTQTRATYAQQRRLRIGGA